MSIGYACITVGVPGTAQRTTIARRATPEVLEELIRHNLEALGRVLDYNYAKGVRVFRVSSDIIPFGSSPVNTLDWAGMFREELAQLGEKARGYGMRFSMHPGQYTVLNTPDEGVLGRAVEDLCYHARFLDALGMDESGKLVLHIGGVYGDKAAATERFKENYRKLPGAVRRRLVIENDDRLYTAEEVLDIARAEGIPMVWDNLHHAINPSVPGRAEAEWVRLAGETWGENDGRQKIHYSQQEAGRRAGSHSETIAVGPFLAFYEAVGGDGIDIMLEVKDKNLSAVKCINCLAGGPIGRLEKEWALYKYTVLERDAAIYNRVRALLKDKAAYPAVEFYGLLEEALARPVTAGAAVNAAQHVWGYFKKQATEKEAARFAALLAGYRETGAGLGRVKGLLARLADKYQSGYLLGSYYFVL